MTETWYMPIRLAQPIPGGAVNTTNFVVQRDGTFVTQRDTTQVVDQRP